MVDSMASETPFFQGEMVPWLYLSVRRSKAGGMHLANPQEFKPVKGLKRPAARLTGTLRPVLSRPFISLEKMGSPMPGEPIRYLYKNLAGNYWSHMISPLMPVSSIPVIFTARRLFLSASDEGNIILI
jgi:hypothetical protein